MWMTTFADMTTLLLVFFVLLISMMTIDVKKFNLVLSAFRDAVGVLEQGSSINLTQEELMNMGQRPEVLAERDEIIRPKHEVQQVLGWISENMERQDVQVEVTQRGFKIMLTDEALFDQGSSEIKPEARALMERIGFFLQTIVPGEEFRIEGHTDDVPIEEKAKFGSNIELSASRATTVYDYLHGTGIDPTRMSVVGYGPNKPQARRPDESLEDWRARNRRVEIAVIWKEEANG